MSERIPPAQRDWPSDKYIITVERVRAVRDTITDWKQLQDTEPKYGYTPPLEVVRMETTKVLMMETEQIRAVRAVREALLAVDDALPDDAPL